MKTTPKNLLKVSCAIFVVTLLYIFVYWPMSPFGHQLHNLKLADEHAKVMREKFKNDVRFQNIKFGGYTDAGGCFSVTGDVQNEDDVRYLTNAVGSIPCPIEIYYSLRASNGLVEFHWLDRHEYGPHWYR